jgi:hypothetical protein
MGVSPAPAVAAPASANPADFRTGACNRPVWTLALVQDDAAAIPCMTLALLGMFALIAIAGDSSWWVTALSALGMAAFIAWMRHWISH